ncbi:hypothetical protein V8C26DRAFT_144816 [Trichoderma gracile]
MRCDRAARLSWSHLHGSLSSILSVLVVLFGLGSGGRGTVRYQGAKEREKKQGKQCENPKNNLGIATRTLFVCQTPNASLKANATAESILAQLSQINTKNKTTYTKALSLRRLYFPLSFLRLTSSSETLPKKQRHMKPQS